MQLCRPAPAYSANAPIGELRAPELFLVAAARLWATPHRDPLGAHPDWRCSFMAAGLDEDAERVFDAFFRILATAALAPLDIRCARCARLGEDEAWLLQLISVLQRDRAIDAAAILEHWLSRAAARIAFAHATGFAVAMARARLVVPHRPGLEADPAPLIHDAGIGRRLALVH